MQPDGTSRLIMDLSQPSVQSINVGIDKDHFYVQYTHFDRAVELFRLTGKNSCMCKVDIMHAFRLLPVKAADWKLLGYQWDGLYFVDVRLPFGSRGSPGILIFLLI